jgi:cell division protease FtsH
LIGARLGRKAIEHKDMEEARDKVRWGKERRSMKMSERELRLTAYHEAGHTLISLFTDSPHNLHKVTIMPRGNAYLGATMYFPEDNKYTSTRQELLDDIATTMGGQVAEMLTFGDITNGASGDIRQATSTARKMVRDWGMGSMGFVYYDSGDEREFAVKNDYSEEVAHQLDLEIRKIIDEQYKRATAILTEHQDKLILLSEELLKRETMSAKEVLELLGMEDKSENSKNDEEDKAAEQEELVKEEAVEDSSNTEVVDAVDDSEETKTES